MNQLIPNEENISRVFSLLGQLARLKIVLAIGNGEACVCHLRQALGYRQAYISQQLILLRQGRIVATRRLGRHIYYRLVHPALLELIHHTAETLGIPLGDIRLTSIQGCEYIPDANSRKC